MRTDGLETAGLVFHRPDDSPFRLDGFYWYDRYRVFRRLPDDETLLPPPEAPDRPNGAAVLSWHTAGGACGENSYIGDPILGSLMGDVGLAFCGGYLCGTSAVEHELQGAK